MREAAAAAGVRLGGENALPCFSPAHADAAALDRIVYNTQAWAPPLQVRPPELMFRNHANPDASLCWLPSGDFRGS